MAITLDAVSDSSFANATSITWSHTVSGSNRCLVVGSHQRISGTLTSCAWNGSNLTNIRKVQGEGNTRNGETWISPDNDEPETGTHNLVVTSPSTTILIPSACSYNGVDTTSPLDNDAEDTDSSTQNNPHGLTTVADDCWLVVFARSQDTVSAGTGATMRSPTQTNPAMLDSNGSVGSAGAYSITISSTAAWDWASIVMSIKPSGGASPSFIPKITMT